MTIPLYKTFNEVAKKEQQKGSKQKNDQHSGLVLEKNANAGLFFDRFFSAYAIAEDSNNKKADNMKTSHLGKQSEWSLTSDKAIDAKQQWLVNNFSRSVGDAQALEQNAFKHLQLLKQVKGCYAVVKTQWHFVTGMGLAHPLENGFLWHPTLAVPYLNAAALKGLLSSWQQTWCAQSPDDPSYLQCFGSQEQAGAVIFFDAVPIEPAQLTIDILTPHMGNWYEQGADLKTDAKNYAAYPADWHAPVPIKFLAVKSAELLISVAPSSVKLNNEQSAIDVEQVLQQLLAALEYQGAGAKTAIAYGQMCKRDDSTANLRKDFEQHQHSIRISQLSTEQQAIENLRHTFNTAVAQSEKLEASAVMQNLQALIKQAQVEQWSRADRFELYNLALAIYDKAGWGKNKKKRQRQDELEKLLK